MPVKPARTNRGRRIGPPLRALLPVLAASWLAGCGYSQIQQLDERAGEARSDIEVQLLRRAELVPSLVETVQRYGEPDEAAVGALADSRVELITAVRSQDLSSMESASASLASALGQLLAAAAGLRDLQTDPGFQRLQAELEDTELGIEQAGRSYNEAVSRYNEFIAGFPHILTAKVIGAERREPYGPPPLPDTTPADG